MGQTQGILSWLDRLNPVALKEFRQCNNNKILLIGCMTVSLILIYVTAVALKIDQLRNSSRGISLDSCGIFLFYATTALWAVVSLFSAGVLGMFRYARERSVAELDVGNFTAMSPHRMVQGRLMAAVVLVIYFYCLCLPVFTLSYILRGLPLEDMLLTHGYAFVMMLCAIQCMLFIGSLGKTANCVAICLLVLFFGTGPIVGLCAAIQQRNFTAPWMILIFVYAVLGVSIFYMMNVVTLSAVHSDKLFGIKATLLACLLTNMTLGWYFNRLDGADQAGMCMWICVCCYQLLALLLALIGYSAPDHVGVRLREKCPCGLLSRFCYYLLSSVWGGGYLLSCAALVIGYGLLRWGCPDIATHKWYIILMNTVGYVIFYLVLTEVIHWMFPRKPPEVQSVYVVMALNIVPLLIFIFLLIIQSGTDVVVEDTKVLWKYLMSLSAIRYGLEGLEERSFAFNTYKDWLGNLIGVWVAAGSFVVAMPLIFRQFRAFKRPTEEEWQKLLTPQDHQESK